MRRPVFGSLTRSDTNQAVQPHRMARGWKFRLKKEEGSYYDYLCSKAKALNSCVVTAQLIYAFVFAYAKSRFFRNVANLMLGNRISFVDTGKKQQQKICLWFARNFFSSHVGRLI